MTLAVALPVPMQSQQMLDHFNRLKSRAASRDATHHMIHQVRRGHINQLFPEELDFSISFNGSPVANFVDIVARDMAEGLAPLPALACVSGRMQTDADQNRAERKNRIGDDYWRHSNLEIQMLSGADRFVTYGFLPFYIEPDVRGKRPFIHVEDPRNAYYELDRMGRPRVYAKKWRKSIDDLCALYPEYDAFIRLNPNSKKNDAGTTELEFIRWVDSKYVTLMLPERQGIILDRYEHRLSRLPVWIAQRPGDDDSPRGQFDDVIWVQVARSIMSTLALEAAYVSVQAPIAVPGDMDQFNYGPHAIMQSDNADKIRRVGLDLPGQVFAEEQMLDQEMRTGARYPDARSGNANASVITGKGVEALLGSFDSQIKGGQLVLKQALQEATSLCFEMDEVWWPHETKTVAGTLSGASYEFTYTPSKDINNRWDCTVTYGFAAGLNPSQSIVTMLQLEGAGLIAKGTTQQNLPFSIDPLIEQRKINVEGSREALKQGLFSLAQSSGELAAQGQDPTQVLNVMVSVIHSLQNGKPIEDAVADAYAAQAQQAQEEAAEQAQQPGAAGPGGDQGGAPVSPQDVQQQSFDQGNRPTIEQMIAGFRGNGELPINQVNVRRQIGTGT